MLLNIYNAQEIFQNQNYPAQNISVSRLGDPALESWLHVPHIISSTQYPTNCAYAHSWEMSSQRGNFQVTSAPPLLVTVEGIFWGYDDGVQEEEMATHSSILAWRTPWTEDAGGLQAMRLQRVRHAEAIWHACGMMVWRLQLQKWQGTELAFSQGSAEHNWGLQGYRWGLTGKAPMWWFFKSDLTSLLTCYCCC